MRTRAAVFVLAVLILAGAAWWLASRRAGNVGTIVSAPVQVVPPEPAKPTPAPAKPGALYQKPSTISHHLTPKTKIPVLAHPMPIPGMAPQLLPATPYVPPVVIPPPEPPAPTEWKGNDTQITHDGEVVIHNDDQWIRFWAEHHPHEPSPDVDFSRRMVIGVFVGARPAEAFTVAITDVRPAADAITVDYQEHHPPPGTLEIGVTVYPYDLKAIPRSNLKVKFNKLQPS